MTRAVVRKLKFGGRVKYEWPGEIVDEVPGEWLVVHHDPARHEKHSFGEPPEAKEPAHFLHYIGLSGPLSLIFTYSLSGQFLDAKCDAALPGTWDGAHADFVDLDLDVVVLPGFQHFVKDQEVFAERASSMEYTDDAKRAAHLGILHALRAVRRRQFPFDGHADDVMRRILGGTRAAK
jgi:hypothetical protein